ncbi:MAG: twin-arginine translocase subunit TatB [Deltaproteobacteria bacterium]|nr:twin-arginine translocase subunit TatB [Deltaproteobacteria bacterium]
MFGLGFQELLVIGILALLILGPKKLPELARTVGKLVREFQRAADDVKKEINTAALDDEPLRQIYPPRPSAVDPTARAYGFPEDPKSTETAAGTATEAASGDAPEEKKPEPAPGGPAGEPGNPGPSPRAG